jgi:hypothetical protein
MKRTLSILLLSISGAAIASNAIFTLNEAKTNCPSPSQINFKPHNPNFPHDQGEFSGKNPSGQSFSSWNTSRQSRQASAPKSLNSISWRNAGGSSIEDYGYKHGNNIVCFYSYDKYVGGQYPLVMDTAHAPKTH